MTQTATAEITAPCGCTFQGRFYSTSDCTVLDPDATGHQKMRHAMAVERKIKSAK